MTPQARATFDSLVSYLRDIGLDSLFSIDSQGRPGGWLWQQLQSGVDSPEELRIRLEQTDVFRDRFGVIQEQQKRAARGEPVYVMSPAEVIEYERSVRQMMSAAGLPGTFYDEPKDFHKLILNDMSPTEVQQRITQAYDYVLSAPPEVRAAFRDYYGVAQGDAALATWALDPDRTVRDVTRATRTAYASGMGTRFDVDMNRRTAERIADLPMTEAGITEGLRQVASLGNVFAEGITETQDLTAGGEGVESVFEGDSQSSLAISRRVLQRRANDRSSTGGAALTQQGVIGAGSA